MNFDSKNVMSFAINAIDSLTRTVMKEKYGDDIILYTTEEAKEQGLTPADFGNIPSYKITAPPIMEQPMILGTPPSGKERRRKRREQERKDKKRKW